MFEGLRTFMEKLEPKDIIAGICLIGSFVLIGLGIDSEVKAIPAFILGAYFMKIANKK